MDIIVLKPKTKKEEIKRIAKKLERWGLTANLSKGTERTIIGVIGDTSKITEDEENAIRSMAGVEDVMRILKPYKLASRDFRSKDTTITVMGNTIGSKKIHVIAGPCAVENKTILVTIGKKVREAGASFIRGGAFKPRTSPYSFQGLGEEGLKYLADVRKKTGLPVVNMQILFR
jgi:3-deoxy-7-phosphoheptulonate synthase